MKRTIFFHSCVGVFQGGGCRAAALVGAYEEAALRGVQFAEIAGTSAGSIIAALVGAGATPKQLKKFVGELDFRRFLQPPDIESNPSFWARIATKPFGRIADLVFHQGFHSSSEIEVWIEECLRSLLGSKQGLITFSDLQLPTSIVATDIVSRRVRVWNQRTSPNDSVAKSVRASCSIPIFFQPVGRQYVDGGALSNLPAFLFAEGATGKPLSSRVLAFVLKADDETIGEWNTRALLSAVANTIVEGSQELQLSIQGNVHVISIPTGKVKATDFDNVDAHTVSELIDAGQKASAEFFDSELARVKAPRLPSDVCYDREDLYGSLTQHLDTSVAEVLICEQDTDFVYALFPSLLAWRMRGARCRVLVPKTEAKAEHGAYRRRLLSALGVELLETDRLPFRAYFVNCHDPIQGSAYVGVRSGSHTTEMEAVVYEGAIHAAAVASLYDMANRGFPASGPTGYSTPSLAPGSQEEVLRRLRTVIQYGKSGVELSFESVRLQDMLSLTQYVREYKYRQIQHLVSAFRDQKLRLFDAAAIVLDAGRQSIVTPPVVEEAGAKFVLIQGSTRATFLRDQGEERVTCIVVRGVKDALPSAPIEFSKVRVVGRSLGPEIRYGGLNYTLFRHIESRVRPLDSL